MTESPDHKLVSPIYLKLLAYDITGYVNEVLMNGYCGFEKCYLASFNKRRASVAPVKTTESGAGKGHVSLPEMASDKQVFLVPSVCHQEVQQRVYMYQVQTGGEIDV